MNPEKNKKWKEEVFEPLFSKVLMRSVQCLKPPTGGLTDAWLIAQTQDFKDGPMEHVHFPPCLTSDQVQLFGLPSLSPSPKTWFDFLD